MKTSMNRKTVENKLLFAALAFTAALILSISTVSATILSTFADGSTTKTLTYTSAGNQSVDIILPMGVNVIKATLDISGEFYVEWEPNFPEASELLADLYMYKPTLADLDNDGDKDIIMGSYYGLTIAFENNGTITNPSWRRRDDWDVPSTGLMTAPAFADLDGDTDWDLIMGSFDGSVVAFENNGTTTNPSWNRMEEWDVPNFGKQATAPTLADLDNDGDFDLVVGTQDSWVIYGFENDGTILSPSWVRSTDWDIYHPYDYMAPNLIDLNQEGTYDLLVGTGGGVVHAFKNNGTTENPTWKRMVDWDLPIKANEFDYTAPAFTDLNGDGNNDVIFGYLYGIKYGYAEIAGNPSNPSFNLDDTTLWTYSGNFTATITTPDFSFELNNYLSTCTTSECIIPLVFSSDSPGRLVLSNLYIEYESVDTSLPTSSNVGQNNTVAGQDTLFYALWEDDYSLSGYIFSTNNSGTWVNDSWKPLSGSEAWTNVTKTLTSAIGIDIGWRIYANDSSDNWGDTGVMVLTTTPPADTTPPTITIASPQNATYGTTSIALEVDADEPIDTWWYSLNGGEDTVFEPNITITAALGVNHLVVYANDTTGNVGSKDVYFTVAIEAETPRKIKEDVITDLEALKAYTTNKHSIKEINKAIEKIEKSLEDELWIGEDHLSAKEGKKVFQNEKEAVERHLMKITEGKGENADPAIEYDVQQVINALVNADKILANISINDAKGITVDPKKQKKYEQELKKAEDEMEKAQEQADKGEYGKAIDHYKKAWEHAQAAIKLGS